MSRDAVHAAAIGQKDVSKSRVELWRHIFSSAPQKTRVRNPRRKEEGGAAPSTTSPALQYWRDLRENVESYSNPGQARALACAHAQSVPGSWVKPCGTRLGMRKRGNGAVRIPKILVLTGRSI